MPKITDPSERGLTPDMLHDIFHYDPQTGSLTWRDSRNGRVKPGSEAGTIPKSGNNPVFVRINGISVTVARIALAMRNGEWPMSPVRYRDGNPDNLQISNLVLAHEMPATPKRYNLLVRELRRVNRAAIASFNDDAIFGPDWFANQELKQKAEEALVQADISGNRTQMILAETDLYKAKRNLRNILKAKRRYLRDTEPDTYPDAHLRQPGRPRKGERR